MSDWLYSGHDPMNLGELLSLFAHKKVLVIGDITLDAYIRGKATELSTEAPVPEILVQEEEYQIGGAANLANNIVSMGGTPTLVGVIGNDESGEYVRAQIKDKHLDVSGLFVVKDRPTTTTTRILVGSHHVARIQKERTDDVAGETEANISQFVHQNIDKSDALIYSDHNKGVMTGSIIEGSTRLARENKKPVIADPSYRRFFDYVGVDAFKPIDKEAAIMTGIRLINESSLRNMCIKLLTQLDCEQVLITSAEYGTVSLEKNGNFTHLGPEIRAFYDVTGEGDASTAAFSLALASNATKKDATIISNVATQIKLAKIGTSVVTIDELRAKITEMSR